MFIESTYTTKNRASAACTINIINECKSPGMVIEDSRVMLQIVASLIDDFRGVIYIHNMLIVLAARCSENKLECLSERKNFSIVFYLKVMLED